MTKLKIENKINQKSNTNILDNSKMRNLSKNKLTTDSHLTKIKGYSNNYNENIFAIGELNKNTCTPDSVVKINKSQPIPKLDPQGLGISSQVDLFNQQLANMQKDIMVNNLKQNKLSLGAKIMMENEKIHAQQAIESGIYVTWCSKDVSYSLLLTLILIRKNFNLI